MQCRILYIPGLGDHYDGVRRLGLLTWRRPEVSVELIPMRWSDAKETFSQKLHRINAIIDADVTPVVLVGESAGGAMAIVATKAFQDQNKVLATVTLCGMNQGAANVNPHLYGRHPAFRTVMEKADSIVPHMDDHTKQKMMIMYSSRDLTVRPKDTLIEGVRSHDLETPGHLISILLALKLRSGLVHHFIALQR